MAYDVFISYSSSNKPVADAICAGLEAEKLRCWIAPRDVLPGQNYGESIVHAIAGCKVMVLVFSAATNVSQAVIREAERAMHNSKPIIPFRIEDTPMSPGLEFFLASCHWLDAIQPPMDTHIAHLARAVKGLIGEGEYIAEKTPPPAPKAKPNRATAIIAGAVALAAAGGFFAWESFHRSTPANQSNTPTTASPSITLTASLAGAGNGAIASHFSSGNAPRYQATEADGVLTVGLSSAPTPEKLTVISPSSDENWLTIPTVELDLKLLNSGTTTAFFQRVVLEVSSSQPENRLVWLADGTRLPGIFSVRPLGGDESAPSISLGIAGPEDTIDRSKLPSPTTMKKGKTGAFEFPLPLTTRPGIEETLFGCVNDLTFEIPLATTPHSKPATAAPKDPEPLYAVQLHESGENYSVACDLSQYIQAGEGDRFFLRIESPVIAHHRFSVKLEYDDGSGTMKFLKSPTHSRQVSA